MGSPYMTLEISKVNVIRTAVGASKLLAQLCHITGHPLDTSVIPRLQGIATIGYATYVSTDQVETELYDAIYQWSGHTFDRTIVEYLMTYAKAQVAGARIVQVVATRYEFEETRLLDRCVVFDFSGLPRTRGLSVGSVPGRYGSEEGCHITQKASQKLNPSVWNDYLTPEAARALGFDVDGEKPSEETNPGKGS